MWSRLPTVEVCRSCIPPFSFYFDVISAYWKSHADPLPLHRVCTLGRKQGATHCLIGSAFDRQEVVEEIDELDESFGGGGSAESVAITFFRTKFSPEDITSIEDNSILGQVTIINYREPGKTEFSYSYIYEAIFKPPALANGTPLLNNFICREAEFDVVTQNRSFKLSGVQYTQQNERTNVCAHASLRMALNTSGLLEKKITSRAINQVLSLKPPLSTGLTVSQLEAVINGVTGIRAIVHPCTDLSPATYISNLASVIESGNLALLAFSTGHEDGDHVVTVFGHTRNSDEWHPQAIPAYTGPLSGRYYASSAWIDHFLIHDDNFGPYYTLSTRALEVDPNVHPVCIIALQEHAPNAQPAFAEGVAAIILSNLLPSLAGERSDRWYEFITRRPQTFVLRTVLISKANYVHHVSHACGHDGVGLAPEDATKFEDLPEYFWMVEFSLPALFTGNRAKLGEVLLDAKRTVDPKKPEELFLAMRMPSMILLARGDEAELHDSQLKSHCPIFIVADHLITW